MYIGEAMSPKEEHCDFFFSSSVNDTIFELHITSCKLKLLNKEIKGRVEIKGKQRRWLSQSETTDHSPKLHHDRPSL